MDDTAMLRQFDRVRFGRFHLTLLLLSGACWMLAAYGVTIIGFMLPALRQEWQVSASALGWLASVGMFGMMIGAIGAGMLSDRIGRRATLAWTLLYLGVIFVISAFAWNYSALLVLRLLAGVGLGAILPVSSTMIIEFSPSRLRGAMSVIMNACWGLGGTVAALAGYGLVLRYGWRPAMWVGALALVLALAVRLLLPESIRFLLSKGRVEAARREFARIPLQPAVDAPAAAVEQPAPLTGRQGGIWSPAYARLTLSLWLLWLALNFLYQGAYVWLPTLLAGTQHSDGRSFLLTLLISLGQVPGTLIVAFLADRASRRRLIIVSLALLAAATFLFGVSQRDAWLLATGFMLMLFNGMAWGMAYPFSSELYPTRMRGAATGWASGIGRLGGVAAPVIIGWIVQAGGSLMLVFGILALAPFLTVLALSALRLETTGRSLEDISA